MLAGVGLGGQRWVVAELGQAEGGEDRNNVGVMAEVEVEGLVEGEGVGGAVEGGVDVGAGVAEGVVLEPCDNFLLVAQADGTAGFGLEATVAGEVEVWEGISTGGQVLKSLVSGIERTN